MKPILPLILLLVSSREPVAKKKVHSLALEVRGETVWCHGVGVLEVALKNSSGSPARLQSPFDQDGEDRWWASYSVFFEQFEDKDRNSFAGSGFVQGPGTDRQESVRSVEIPAGAALTALVEIHSAPTKIGVIEVKVGLSLKYIEGKAKPADIEVEGVGKIRLSPDRKGCVVANAV